ncbi:conserved hypothetical protein [Ricinus communis]|uniref:Uncharacterized protein n=1 Tax=Ricinus communis TaxID=3988 RepID=B9SVR5_RICCO|nr:conserved hypothetical protein [Ricinus communis]
MAGPGLYYFFPTDFFYPRPPKSSITMPDVVHMQRTHKFGHDQEQDDRELKHKKSAVQYNNVIPEKNLAQLSASSTPISPLISSSHCIIKNHHKHRRERLNDNEYYWGSSL